LVPSLRDFEPVTDLRLLSMLSEMALDPQLDWPAGAR
jgi:hypothetical protein